MDFNKLLSAAAELKASDIHISPGRPPFLRMNGEMKYLKLPAFTAKEAEELIFSILDQDQIDEFKLTDELDASLTAAGIGRFRVNVMNERNGTAATLRVISTEIPSAKTLMLEESILNLTKLPRGLVLVTGPTGSGKSTTLACMIDLINRTQRKHILTIEDPIEFIYPEDKCLISQREVTTHTESFASAMKYAMRQDPDVVLLGEMRDLETISTALTLAETGHLVFASLHTTDAAQTIDRIVDVFPPYQQQQIRTQLSLTLKGVVCQQLLPRADGTGRVAAREIMHVTNPVAALIRSGQTHQIYSVIDTGMQQGMKSLDRSIGALVKSGMITLDTALSRAAQPDAVRRYSQM